MYEVWYRVHDSGAEFVRYGETLYVTQLKMINLENDVTYDIRLRAGNKVGWGRFSPDYDGTPKGLEGKEPQNLPTEGILDNSNIESIWLRDPNNNVGGRLDDATILIDNDYSTHWTTSALYSYGDEHVFVKFKTPQDLCAALWIARLDGTFPKSQRSYCIRVWYDGEDLNREGHLLIPDPEKGGLDYKGRSDGREVDTWPNCPNYGTTSEADGFVYMPFGPVTNVKQICVACEQHGYLSINMSELKFMVYDPNYCLPDQISNLFEGGANGLHETLKSGVTQDQITTLRERLNSDEKMRYLNVDTMADELDLAEELLSKKSSDSSVILKGIESRSTGPDQASFSQSGSDLQPLGATAQANSRITVYAQGIQAGDNVTLYATQFNGEVTAWRKDLGTLQNGRNIIEVPKIGSRSSDRGGSLYISYSGTNNQNIQLHVRRGIKIPTLRLENWYTLDKTGREAVINTYLSDLDAYMATYGKAIGNNTTSTPFDYRNVTELSLPRVLLSLPVAAVQTRLQNAGSDKRTDTLYNAILAWEELVRVCEETQGIIDPTEAANTKSGPAMQSRQNIRCMTMFTGAFMYAAGNHIGIGYASCGDMVAGKPTASTGTDTNGLYGWGIAHEIGHNMDKLGKAECTNNIYSILAQTWDGSKGELKSRMELEDRWPTILDRTAQAYPGTASNVFTQLGMYYQLHLAYDGANPLDFYNKFFNAWKDGTYTKDATNYDEKVALTAAGVTDKNLNEFFRHWGMELSAEVKKQIGAKSTESRAIWYLTDQSRRDALANKSNLSGSISATAQVIDNKDVKITITPGATTGTSSIQGYEILRNGKSIGFVMAKDSETVTYTDRIGSANNMAFEYTVVAYDTLGNKAGSKNCGQVRISYDETVPEDQYSVYRNGNDVTFKLVNPTAVSGFKLTNLPGDYSSKGSYAVKITVGVEGVAENNSTKTAKIGSYDVYNVAADTTSTYLTYFNRPGAAPEDTRIGIYDAVTVTITNVPATDVNNIKLISYAHDNVTIEHTGQLTADYEAGFGTIPKGSLVTWGYYCGDPVLCGMRLKGRFLKNSPASGENDVIERSINGDVYMFAEIPQDGEISTISDGIYLFVYNLDAEKELLKADGFDVSSCNEDALLPFEIQAEFYRKDDATTTESSRIGANTLWTQIPGMDHMPFIELR